MQLGFSYNDVRKGVYIDKFDADKTAKFCNNTYLPKCRETDRRGYRYVPLSWRAQCDNLDIKVHPSYLNPDGYLIREDAEKPPEAESWVVIRPIHIDELEWQSVTTPDAVNREEWGMFGGGLRHGLMSGERPTMEWQGDETIIECYDAQKKAFFRWDQTRDRS